MTYNAQIDTDRATPLPQRAQGALHLTAKRRGAESVIADLRQQGALKVLFPRSYGSALEAVFLNTAGGLTGGDRMALDIAAGPGAHIVLSSQAAERGYAALDGQIATVDVTLQVADGGRIDWLPQETILFDAAALNRQMNVDLAGSGQCLIVEPVIFGRVAMGEVVHQLHFTDHWRIRRDGALIFADSLRLIGDADALLARPAIAGGAGAMATLLLAAPSAAGLAGALHLPATAGASLLSDDLLLIRLLSADGFTLRRDLIPLIEALSAAPIPRVWRL
ncbi:MULTISPECIES: urease accessory protein UreD [unclassified Yoonia]|uniref:urease accessory protein UreD n=1 Tax=unclassified Yoonia TaxID=2629118 RepID=UPI002AFDECBC|nr:MULTISPECIES: urease accessory protein UreD [unclassified Yoonia]